MHPRRRRWLLAAGTCALLAGIAVAPDTPAGAAPAPGSPSGFLDAVTVSGTAIVVTGWAADPDSADPLRVALVLDGVTAANTLAEGYRPDVARVFPAFGPDRGYRLVRRATPGLHRVCAVAINVRAGANRALGCASVTVAGAGPRVVPPPPSRRPFGHLDSLRLAAGALSAVGWSTDPNSTGPTLVDLTVNGRVYGSARADVSRPDVARVFPAYGAAHGFRATVAAPTTSGNYEVCVTGVNTGAGPNTVLGCRLVTVLPSGVPATLGVPTAAAAADALQQQAIRAGAARSSEFPGNASPAARLALAARALLQQATGRRAPPAGGSGLPRFTVVTAAKPVDEQAVMGPTPDLGSYPAATTGGRGGSSRAVQPFAQDALPAPASAGDGLVGAAAVLPANGTTVRPLLPGYPRGYTPLRAELAVDAALSQLGVPYVYAAAGPASFDCSGLTEWAWAKAGVPLDHYTVSQSRQGVRVRPNQLLPGDLVLFGRDLHHVGTYLGAGYMVDAPYTGAYVRVDKISWDGDFTLAVRP